MASDLEYIRTVIKLLLSSYNIAYVLTKLVIIIYAIYDNVCAIYGIVIITLQIFYTVHWDIHIISS